jgi:predicted alpha-1,2-mannosidase
MGRRSFLKGSSLALAASTVGVHPLGAAAESDLSASGSSQESGKSSESVLAANPLQGTNSSFRFSRGNTLPIAARPFGMAHWTIQSTEDSAWMFDPWNRRIQGFRCTHQLSPWLSDYGYAVFLPVAGNPKPSAQARSSSWRPERSTLAPHSFQLELLRYRISAELIPTERCALITADYTNAERPGFLIDTPGREVTFESDADARTIRFTSMANRGGVPENFATYYVVQFDTPWDSIQTVPGEHNTVCVLHFSDRAASKCNARIATSFISFEQATRNLSTELGHKTAGVLRDEAAAQWNFYARRVEIDGGIERQKKIFFSCLYRALLFPRTWHEFDSTGNPYHFSPYDGKVHPGVLYADHGYWDVYRAWYPLMSILYPEKLAEILQAWVNAYREGGWLPQFPCPGYRACMTGSLIDAVFGDAAVKGIKGFDLATAYEGLKKHATQPGDPAKGYGRRGIEGYLKYGYVPTELVEQSVAETVDAAYGDFCIAQVAEALGHHADARMFRERSRNWRNLFDAKTGFLRGKQEDGGWLEPFDEFQWGSPYVEGSAWQHRWDVPHDINELIEQMGGKTNAIAALEKMLTLEPVFHTGIYGAEIHEMSEMAAVDFGQYAHSNQPVHHMLYAFAVAGRPDRTQYWVHRVLNELYAPDDFPGDEDTGSMSAWFLLSAMGFYPLCPGKPEYVLGSPLFNKVTLHLANGKTLEIEAEGQSENAVYVANVSVNGNQHRSIYLPHEAILRGGRIVFRMQNKPAGSWAAS